MRAGIYKITNTINGKIYIGQAQNIQQRFRGHKSLLNKNSHKNKHLQYAWNKYGKDSFKFEIIETVDNISLLNDREQYWLDKEKPYDREIGYNIAKFAESTGRGRICTEFEKQNLREKNIGKKASTETLIKQSIGMKLFYANLPDNEKKRLGKIHAECAVYARTFLIGKKGHMTGKHHTAEAKEKNRKAHVGKLRPIEDKNGKIFHCNNCKKDIYKAKHEIKRNKSGIFHCSKQCKDETIKKKHINIIEMWDTGEYTKEQLSEKFNLHKSSIGQILLSNGRKTWDGDMHKINRNGQYFQCYNCGNKTYRSKGQFNISITKKFLCEQCVPKIKNKMTIEDVIKIRELWNTEQYSCKQLYNMFNISRAMLYNIVYKKSWKNV